MSDKKKKSKKNNSKKDKNKDVKESKKLSLKELLEIEKDKNIRLFAEFDNFRKRTAKERLDLFSTANQELITNLLPVLDNFERSINANNYSDEDGPVLIFKQLKSELEKKGLKEIESPIGKTLDTDFHEAITNIPAPSKKEKGKVIDVIEKGYMLGEKVLRYAKVVIGN
ncbi:MAG: nucleotide exchange factor GrpE [Flavobacteriales bacterium]|nr:nucleotide exchange factor GrpE [Flavobacteriales bacterium]|tara:strand:+ start:54038 stop:54544 length:507 start_codon:yes stop_codon:yes gene_type:complete